MRIFTHSFFSKSFVFSLLIGLIFAGKTHISAQQAHLSLNGSLLIPQYDFAYNSPNEGFMLSAAIGGSSKRLPFLFYGVELGLGTYGFDCWEDTYYDGGYEYWGEFERFNDLAMGGVFVRLEPRIVPWFRPYAEAQIGGTLFYTREKIYDPDLPSDCYEEIASYNLERDLTSYIRYGGGLLIPISCDAAMYGYGSYLDIGVSFQRGGKATYMVEGSDLRYRSFTDMMNIRFGWTFKL